MKLLPFARVRWPQTGTCLPFLAPEFDFLLFAFIIQQTAANDVLFLENNPCTVVLEIVAQLPELLKNISAERLKILKPAATYGWKESSESRNPPGSMPAWKDTGAVDEVLGTGEMPAAQKDTSLLLQTNPTKLGHNGLRKCIGKFATHHVIQIAQRGNKPGFWPAVLI